jgi:hypothetical protein
MTGGVVRRWEAMIARSEVSAWLDTFRTRAFPGMRAVEGFKGIRIHLQRDGDPCRLTVFREWSDMAAIKRYAGETPGKTVMPNVMAPFFASYDATASFHDELELETSL